MGLFGDIASKTIEASLGGDEADVGIYDQQSACAIKFYPNGNEFGNRKTRILWQEVTSCKTNTSTSDIGGSFSFTLLATEPWDEIIQPDDFIRIFMGDRSATLDPKNKSLRNAALGDLKETESEGSNFSPVYVYGVQAANEFGEKANKFAISKIMVQEKFIGKIDRVEVNESAPSINGASVTSYTVYGRSLGSILQDITLYYNPYISGMNAATLFFNSGLQLSNSPSGMIEQFITVLLSTVPLPQWRLPSDLIKEYSLAAEKNVEKIKNNLNDFLNLVNKAPNTNKVNSSAVEKLNGLVSKASVDIEKSPLAIISLDMKDTFGSIFNRNFMSSNTTGAFDLIKSISNDFANELIFDLCPVDSSELIGSVDAGTPSLSPVTPTISMRQRPYDIIPLMLSDLYEPAKPYADKINSDFVAPLSTGSKSLPELSDNSIFVFGPLSSGGLGEYKNASAAFIYGSPSAASPSLVDKNIGIAGHDRHNGFMVLTSTSDGAGGGAGQRLFLSDSGGFKVDTESIEKYGFRMMEVNSICGDMGNTKEQKKSYLEELKNFTDLISNWYFMNPVFLNGTMTCRFIPDARIGVPCVYYETRITPKNPYPKMEAYYTQGVGHSYTVGQPILTTLTVIRGLRYDLSNAKQTEDVVADSVKGVGDYVKGFFA